MIVTRAAHLSLLAVLAAAGLASAKANAQDAKKPEPAKAAKGKPEAPPPPLDTVRLWLVAPSARGVWTLRIDNEGELPVRIPADARLLRLEIETPDGRRTKRSKCGPPDGLRSATFPETRALILKPGESYVELIDPVVLCFGKDAAALTGGATVRARFGWDPPPKYVKKAPQTPFAAEALEQPRTRSPVRELRPPTILLSHSVEPGVEPPALPDPDAPKKKKSGDPPKSAGTPSEPGAKKASEPTPPPKAEPEPPASAPIVDPNAPRLELSVDRWGGGSTKRNASVTVTAQNAGERPMVVAVRSRMLTFQILGSNGLVTCPAGPQTRAIPRDLYRTMKPRDKASLTVLLDEVCPAEAFERAGIYRVWPTIHANEPGTELGLTAYTGTARVKEPAVLRIVTGKDPYHASPPMAAPTPKPAAADD